jgi:hypothetical protein
MSVYCAAILNKTVCKLQKTMHQQLENARLFEMLTILAI